jgi:alginate O-acetyltransferase complex protein AlgI
MLFHSEAFAIFLPLVFIAYWALGSPRLQNVLLVVASCVFYGWWDWRFLGLLAISIVVDYACALSIDRARERGGTGKPWLVLSLFTNLGMLGIFKYYDFFVESAAPIWHALGWRPDLLHVVLPIGISFYTFQTLSYTVDVYRGQLRARSSFIDVAAFVSFFPQLVAGPIERAGHLLPQLEQRRTLSAKGVRLGLMLIAVGFFKKVVIADGIAPMVDMIYADAASGAPIRPEHSLISCFAFILQIYGDFAGYSDIARGVARLLGIDLVINFRQPYLARRYQEIFDRWHISLSTWLRDYVFIPLGGTWGSRVMTARNLFLTMVLAGLWHGAAWTFAIWGVFVGAALALDHVLPLGESKTWSVPGQALGIVVTQLVWCVPAHFFRAPDVDTAFAMVGSLAGPWGLPDPIYAFALFLALAGLLAVDLPQEIHPEGDLVAAEDWVWQGIALAVIAVGFALVRPLSQAPFMYFQF